ncbi:MAG TPA: exodeoxyribonuclease V subunit beta [Terriglobales bacterium]|nr:exodeoxyribonuclease V subunit beta [Terriglobales bacterium]
MSRVYDPASSPLDGRALIESSAGTGKTYAIAERYVRLLLERKLRVEQMLVVTFTHAAVAELTDRIRKKIKEKLSECRKAAGDEPEGKAGRDRESDRRLLEDALRTFDLASIQTIHGFCGRALQDNAFESASLFDTEVVPDDGEIVRRAVNDFFLDLAFRKEPGGDPFLRPRVFKKFGKRKDVLSLVRKCHGNPFLIVEPEETGESPSVTDSAEYSAAKDCFFKAFSNARDAVTAPGEKEKILALLLDGSLNGKTYHRDHLPGYADVLFTWIEEVPSLPIPEKLHLFCDDQIESKVKKGCVAPAHPAFERFTELRVASEAFEPILERLASAWVVRLRIEMLRKTRAAIRGLKVRKNVRSYDDLLLDLHEALFGPPEERRGKLTAHGERLARALKSRYKAVLIDEFQDTDPVQYEIFTGIFSDVAEDALLLVGDPKQSIYRFRNADVFAYRQAREAVPEDRRFRLGRNYRAVPSLVRAVNAVFEGARDPFVFDWIPFEKVESNRKEADGLGGAEAGGPSSLVFWHVEGRDPSGKGKEITKGSVEEQVLGATAGNIVRLLKAGACGKVTFGGNPLLPKDVAVLVRTNREARDVRDSLVDHGVPCVLYCSESVFATTEAETFRTFLAGVANPADERKVRAALATDLFGLSGVDLDDLAGKEDAWAERIRDFIRFRETWEEKGIAAMCRGVFSSGGVRSRLLSSHGGERALTNLLHLAELLQEFEAGAGGVERTVAWLDARKAEAKSKEEGATAAEEHQLRLETDASAVKVVTVHKCKGLQYPVVFLPFAWRATRKDWRERIEKKEGVFYHEDGLSPRAVRRIDDIPDEKRALADREELAESARLFYVALTRAVARCYVVWGGVKDAERTGAAWVLHGNGKSIGGSPASEFPGRFKAAGDEAILADLKALAESEREGPGGEPAIRVESLPKIGKDHYKPATPQEAAGISVRTFPTGRRIDLRFGETSFTALSRRATDPGAAVDPEAPDRDPARPEVGAFVAAPDPWSIHAFPAGAKAGIFFHELLEAIDFGATEEVILDATRKLLPLHGLDIAWEKIVAKQISSILSLPLKGAGEPFTLSSVSRTDRLSEVRFAFPVRKFDGGRGAPDPFEGISFPREEGILKGAIDLVCRAGERFYLLDWKSNRLGPDADHYSIERIGEEMSSQRYRLQADIYAVALHLYLKKRLPGYAFDRHFGGTFYLFFRGIDPAREPGSGVWFDRPDEGRVERISKAFAGEGWAQ